MRKGKQKVHIPNPDSKPIGQGLLNEILRQAGISEDDWENV
jgi:predicted RNA binding protein YcfA (HicA-like mRNA interferase family)